MEGNNDANGKLIHPAAEIFPMMPMAELKTLADDIKTNGLIEPILLHEDKVLDGRNRLIACSMAGVEPRFEVANVNGGSPTLFVVSKNLHRRHLSVSQRAAISTNLLPMLKEEAKERLHHAQDNGRRHRWTPPETEESIPQQPETNRSLRESATKAAKAMQVGKTLVYSAVAVKQKSPEEFDRVMRGETTVSKAYDVVMGKVRTTPEKKHQAIRTPGKRQQQREHSAKKRMVEVLSHIRGLCKGVGEMNVPLIAAGMDKAERRTWIQIAYDTSRQLRVFGRKLGAEL